MTCEEAMSGLGVLVLEVQRRKAEKLAEILRTFGCEDGETALLIDAEGRRYAEKLAGVRESSDKTWQRVARFLDEGADAPLTVTAASGGWGRSR